MSEKKDDTVVVDVPKAEAIEEQEDKEVHELNKAEEKADVEVDVVEKEPEAGDEEEPLLKERFDPESNTVPLHPFIELFQNKILLILGYVAGGLGLIAYTIASLVLNFQRALPILYIEIFVMSCLLLNYIFSLEVAKSGMTNFSTTMKNLSFKMTMVGYFCVLAGAVVVSIILTRDDLSRMSGLGGLLVLIFLCYALSWDRKHIKWRPVVWGFSLQFIFGILILRTEQGENTFEFFGAQINALQNYTDEGVEFVFGEETSFAFTVLPIIIFYSGITSVLFYFGILQGVTKAVGNTMVYTMGTSAPESLSAAGNIFLGQTESPLLIRPYLPLMTNSELHAVMTGGFATIAGGVLAAYISFGIPASHLLSASVMSAPAALAISKIVYPETVDVDDSVIHAMDFGGIYSNAIEAFSSGASLSIGLIANIIVNLIAFLAVIAFLNEVVTYSLEKVGVDDINFENIIGFIFSPCALLMGIPFDDLRQSGELLGVKIVGNEFVAYLNLIGSDLDPDGKTFLILTYALCGFSNFSSIGIQLGALGQMAPSKIQSLSKMALSAMICGNIACFMTACIASVLLP